MSSHFLSLLHFPSTFPSSPTLPPPTSNPLSLSLSFFQGVLAIPLVYQQSGLIPTLAMLTFFLIISSLSATCLAQSIAMIPDNSQYEQRIEFGTAVKYYYGHRWHYFFQIFLNITVQAYNIASVVICAQSLDQAFLSIAGETWGLEFYPHPSFTSYTDIDVLYNSTTIGISVGYLLITLFIAPMGFMNLNDNVKTVQLASFIFFIILMLEFIIAFIYKGTQDGVSSLPVFGSTYSQLVSVFIFSWAYIIFVPSWLNEKKDNVSVNKVIWSAGIASWIGYIAIGLLCAIVYPGLKEDDMLIMLSKYPTPVITRVTAHLFSLGVIAPGIPVCSVTTRYNLYVGGVCSKKMSYFWGCVAPWLVGWIFCQGEIFAQLLVWTSLIFNGIVNFIVPFIMYLTACKVMATGGGGMEYSRRSRGTSHVARGARGSRGGEEEDIIVSGIESGSLNTGLLGASYVSSDDVLASPPAPPISSFSPTSSPSSSSSFPPPRTNVPLHSLNHSPSLCSSAMMNFTHHPIYPFPVRLEKYSCQLAYALLISTIIVIVAQTLNDAYFLIVKHENILS